MASQKSRNSDPELRRYSVFTGLDRSFREKQHEFSYDNPALENDNENDPRIHEQPVGELVGTYTTATSDYTGRRYSTALKGLKPFRPSSKDGKMPVNKAGLLSYMFVSWMTPLVLKMFKHSDRELEEGDIWQCSDWESCKVNTDRLESLWKKEVETKGEDKASMFMCWLKFSKTRIFFSLLIVIINALSTFLVSGFLLNEVIAYMERVENNILYGIGLTVAMLAANILRAGSFCVIIIFGAQTGIRFRAGFLGMAYKKMLRLKRVKGKSLAEIINIFGGDAVRVYINCVTFVYILALPVYMIIGAAYTYYLIGPWCFIAMGVFVMCYFLQAGLTKGVEYMRRKTLVYTDKRVRKMTEVLDSMKLLKMYAWEDPFQEMITAIRKQEKKYLLGGAILNSISAAIIPVTPTLASVATIGTYRAFGNDMTASTAFSVIGSLDVVAFIVGFTPFITRAIAEVLVSFARLKAFAIVGTLSFLRTIVSLIPYASRMIGEVSISFNRLKAFTVVGTLTFLRIVVAFIPYATRMIGEVRVSFSRLKRLLLQEEYEPHGSLCRDENNSIELENAFFMWEESEVTETKKKKKMKTKTDKKNTRDRAMSRYSFHIERLNFTVEKGKLIGVCGPVGSGKSSLMAAILARMPFISGHTAVNGSVAYAAQQAWIFNDTVRQNILFGKPYDPERYKDVIYSCGLEPDLAILENGDETEIGERGANISGGQKQRVSLARAVYSDSDIYLLDDPLSAVDVHVGRHLFHTCIKKRLAGKTVVLATHQLQYLKHCDEIVVFEEGGIVERGPHEILLANDGYYKQMMDKFHYHTNTSMEKQLPEPLHANASNGKEEIKNKPVKAEDAMKNNKEITKDLKPAGKLTEKEEMVLGKVRFGTYKSYINAAGGFIVCFLVMMSYSATMGSVVFTDWWLGFWINSMSQSNQLQNISIKLNETQTYSFNNTITTTPIPMQYTNSESFYFTVYVSSLGGIILLTILRGFTGATTMIRASVNLHKVILKKVMLAPMKFFDTNPTGRILNRFSKDFDEADVFIPQMTDSTLQIMNTVILSLLTTAIVLPWILVAMVPVIIVLAIMKNISNASIRQMKRVENVTRSPMLAHVNTTAQGLFTIVPFNQQNNFIDSSLKLIDVTSTATFLFEASMRWTGVRLDLVSSLITVATALAMVLTKGSISPALAGLALTMCVKVVGIMQFMVRVMNETEARFTSIERLHHYEKKLEMEPQTMTVTPSDNWPNEGRLIFSKAVMKYRDDMKPVLRDISFDIYPQMKIGIVGRTGAGKSSLAAALFRLVELSDGHIYIDGVDVAQVALKTLRSRLSTIPQDPVLFAGTLRYNLDPFEKQTDADLWDALEKAHMKDKIQQFEQGLDYQIEENGENFSVGERQLICLARAILRRNKILLLDEATASIDTQTDSLIQQTIKEAFNDCTVLTIAHRLNTVLHSDLVMIMDNGEVIETGTPQDLLSDPHSFFNAMVAAQTVKTPSP